MHAIFLTLAFVAGTSDDDDALAALALAAASAKPAVVPVDPPIPKAELLRYVPAVVKAVKEQRVLVAFVGCEAREVPGTLVCSAKSLPDFPDYSVVIAVPRPGYLEWKATLPGDASDSDIQAAVRMAVGQSANPFPPSLDPRSVPRKTKLPALPDDPGGEARSGPVFEASHNCPQCGARQTLISGAGPVAGTHTHTCQKCSTVWYH